MSVYPVIGSRVASPQTQIAFRGVNPYLLNGVQVSGSSSGPHPGSIVGDSDGHGGSFIPANPFTPGETVTVTTPFHLVGAPGGTYRFQVAMPALKLFPQRLPIVGWRPGYTLRFHSEPDLKPATVRILKHDRHAGSADIFLTPQYGPLQNGPMIVSPSGGLLWFMPVPRGDIATDLSVQSYRGKPVLTWWQGYSGSGTGAGIDEIYDTSYRKVATVQAANGLSADLHEFQLTPRGTALITSYYPVVWDASSVGGAKQQIVFDGVVQEIDIATGLVEFQWDSLDHVPLSDTYSHPRRPHAPFDYFHVNSVQQDDDGNLIISARNTWAAYKVNRTNGAIIWTLGGKHSSFHMGPGAGFAFQHDVRVRGTGDRFITMFDDGAGPPSIHRQSRGLKLVLDLRRRTARVAEQDVHTPALSANFEGNLEQLPSLDDFVGWGQQPYFSEFDPQGHLLLDGRFVSNTSSYRAYRFNWSATPATSPAVAAQRGRKGIVVYASWNGATNVASWAVQAGASAQQLRPEAKARTQGFETAITIHSGSYVRVVALDARGTQLGASSPVAVH